VDIVAILDLNFNPVSERVFRMARLSSLWFSPGFPPATEPRLYVMPAVRAVTPVRTAGHENRGPRAEFSWNR